MLRKCLRFRRMRFTFGFYELCLPAHQRAQLCFNFNFSRVYVFNLIPQYIFAIGKRKFYFHFLFSPLNSPSSPHNLKNNNQTNSSPSTKARQPPQQLPCSLPPQPLSHIQLPSLALEVCPPQRLALLLLLLETKRLPVRHRGEAGAD